MTKVLNDGFVRYIDHMGSDDAVVQAARVSYGTGTKSVSDDRTLIRYLMRMSHWSCFEMCEVKFHVRVPFDAWKQWSRHRTACLSGDTELDFQRGDYRRKKSIKETYNSFQPTVNSRPDRLTNSYHFRQRVQNKKLRAINEETNTITYTHITDIWQTGIKPVYQIQTLSGNIIKASKDHLFYTNQGWLKVEDLLTDRKIKICILGPACGKIEQKSNKINYKTEQWKPVPQWEDLYEVSSQGRIRSLERGDRAISIVGKQTYKSQISLCRSGIQETHPVSRLMAFAFLGESNSATDCVCHNDGNALNNVIENLRWDTPQSNSQDMCLHGTASKVKATFEYIQSITLVGEEMTYDLEVMGPYHNFSANGFIVHNSINEYSTRYSEAIDSMYTAGAWRMQSKSNKQGSSDTVIINEQLSDSEKSFQHLARKLYEDRLRLGVARELARKDLPLSTYTEAYWKIDLRNLFHFLKLRLDEHAQWEIRQYAQAMAEITKELFPVSYEAFEDYVLNAITFSRTEIEYIKRYTYGNMINLQDMNKREAAEFRQKLLQIGIIA